MASLPSDAGSAPGGSSTSAGDAVGGVGTPFVAIHSPAERDVCVHSHGTRRSRIAFVNFPGAVISPCVNGQFAMICLDLTIS